MGKIGFSISNEILDLGFVFTDKITLLGFTLQNYGDITAANFNNIILKIDKLIRFWDRFFLSLPGKITIYKTFLISQINYVASIFTPNEEQLVCLENKLELFVTKGFSLSKDRIYAPVSEGGLGLFKLQDFITALQCGWIKRAVTSINDNWKHTIATLAGGDVCNVVADRFTMDTIGSTLGNLVISFCKFKEAYCRVGNNFMSMQLYCNNAFGYGRGMVNKLDENFFSITELGQDRDRLLKITWLDLTVQGILKGKDDVEYAIGCRLTNEKYNLLSSTYNIARKKYGIMDGMVTPINEFMNRFKKGSKNFRKIIISANNRVVLQKSRQVQTFCRLIDCDVPEPGRVRNLFTTWNNVFYPCHLRVFLFKYYNNILGVNSRVAHFNNTVDGGCTFCLISGPHPVAQETVMHLFFACPVTRAILDNICMRYLNNNLVLEEKVYFLGTHSDFETENKLLSGFFDIVRYLIWQSKLENKLPMLNKVLAELDYLIKIILGASKMLNDNYNNSEIFQNGDQRRRADNGPP
jgi:hypothetical protein